MDEGTVCKIKLEVMKIVVFGASGKTGRLLTEQALASGNAVVAYVRNKDSVTIVHPSLEVVEGQLYEKDKLILSVLWNKPG